MPTKKRRTSLTSLPQSKITTGLKRIQENGLTSDRWLQMLNATPEQLRRIVEAFPGAPAGVQSKAGGIVFDADTMGYLLGLRCECNDTVPEAAQNEIVIYYGGWTLATLCNSVAGKGKIQINEDLNITGCKSEPGYYRVILRAPGGARMTWDEQVSGMRRFDKTFQPAPVAVAASALLVGPVGTRNDVLYETACRCAEELPHGRNVTLLPSRDGGMSIVSSYSDARKEDLKLAIVQKIN